MKYFINRQRVRQITAAGLATLISFQTVLTVPAAPVAATYDETMYITLDDEGGIKESSIVKRYMPNGSNSITDYGNYSKVSNLTTEAEPVKNADGSITFPVDQPAESFYFEGTTEVKAEELPWTITTHYYLNGVEKKPDELVGEKGLVKIVSDMIPNKNVSAFFRNNMALTVATGVDMDKNLSFSAEGAQVQTVGNMKAMVFMVLPGEEQHLTLEIGSDDFEFTGLVFMMVPLTLAQLDKVSDIREAKDTLKDSADAVSDSLDVVLDSLGKMQTGLTGTIDGLHNLDQTRQIIQGSKGEVYARADEALLGLADLSEKFKPFSAHTTKAQTALTDLRKNLDNIVEQLDDMGPYCDHIKEHTYDLSDDVLKLVGYLNGAEAQMTAQQLLQLTQKTEGDLAGFKQSQQLLNQCLTGIGAAAAGAGSRTSTLAAYSAYLKNLTGADMDDMVSAMTAAGVDTSDEDEVRSFLETYMGTESDSIDTLAAAIASMMDLSTGDGLVVDDRTNTNPEIVTYGLASGSNSSKASKALSFSIASGSNYLGDANLNMSGEEQQALAGLLKATSGLAGNTALTDDLLAVASITEQVLKLTYTKRDNINGALTGVAEITSAAGHIFNELDDLTYEVDELNRTLNRYHSGAKQTLADLGNMTDAAARGIDALRMFSIAVENQLKSAGDSLNAGTDKTLNGLADTLKELNAGLNQTDTLRNAKDTIKGTMDDKWDEYSTKYTTILDIDLDAEPDSLTSSQNDHPQSIQIVMRTPEITKDDDDDDAKVDEDFHADGNFLHRIANIFRKIWKAIMSIFE